MDDEFDLNDFASEDIDDQFDFFDLVDDESDPISDDAAIGELVTSARVGGASNSEKQMTPERVQKYVQERPKTRKKHAKKEKELRDIVLRAAECGYADVMRQALPMLDEVRRRLKQKPEWRLNFCEGKGGGSPPWNKQFYSPLMYACEGGHTEMVKVLLDEEARMDYVGGQFYKRQDHGKQTGSGLNAMHVACIKGRADVVQLLITYAEDNLLKVPLKSILNAKSKDKWTPLMYAVKEGHIEVVKLLLAQRSLDILAVNGRGQTVLHVAGLHCRLDCLKEIHAKLPQTPEQLAQMSDEHPYLKTDKSGYNVLHRVCKGRDPQPPEASVTVETLKWIFEVMPQLDNPNIHNMGTKIKGYSMLLLACDNGNKAMMKYLLEEKGVDVSSTTTDGKTGLHLAALHDYPEVAEMLVGNGISLTAQDNERKRKDSEERCGGDTALHIAVRKSSHDVEQVIRSLDGAAEVQQVRNISGETPDEVQRELIIPLEIRRLGETVVQQYLQLLRKGKKKKMPRCNLIALGEQGVGKTSLLCLLMGKGFLEDRESTHGIDNEHVDVTESRAVSSETWTEVKSEDIARRNESQFASSVAEGVQPHLPSGVTPERAPPPTPEALAEALTKIDKYLKKVEKDAKRAPVHVPTKTPAPQAEVPTEANVTAPKASASSVSVPQAATTHHTTEPPTEHRTAAPQSADPSDTATPKPEQPEKEIKPHPPHSPPRAADPPARHRRNTRRQSDIGRRMGKSIVSTAKRGLDQKEPVLQYNTLDFAGQKEYHAMHHCFIVRRAIYLVVFNLQVLRESSTPEYKQALEEIHYWLNSIHAHIHDPNPHYKRVLLVGTHRSPNGVAPLADEELLLVDKALSICHPSILNELYRADLSGKLWFAAVENSIDGREENDREESGAKSLQKAIHCAWNDLPFKDEEYPTTWLRFEAFLNRMRSQGTPLVNAETIRQTARDEYGIGEENEADVELALGFFHDTGTIVYPRKLPSLYLNEEEKKTLDGLILLDPTWLMKMMRVVIELSPGTGSLPNDEMKAFGETGCAKVSLLRTCWKELSDDAFHKLCLMLQSFCLLFPLPFHESPEMSTEGDAEPSQMTDCHCEEQTSSKPETVYLIPSKLCVAPQPTTESINKAFKFTFVFDFHGFLPVEVYHRLLCLMLKNQSCGPKLKGTFTAEYFKVYGVHNCNWMVQMVDSKLRVSVKFPQCDKFPPSTYVLQIHVDYLRAICNEKGSSLQGLTYDGGPEHMCEDEGGPVVVPYVKFPKEKNQPEDWSWKCILCLDSFKSGDVDLLLDPKFKEDVLSGSSSHTDAAGSTTATEQLGIDDLFPVLTAIVNVSEKWLTLGLALGLKQPTLKRIKTDNRTCDSCKYELMEEWLNGTDGCRPSWAELAKALREDIVGHGSIADMIEKERLK
jgi:ankyrin repeat protein/GTPase SAR1 family protein